MDFNRDPYLRILQEPDADRLLSRDRPGLPAAKHRNIAFHWTYVIVAALCALVAGPAWINPGFYTMLSTAVYSGAMAGAFLGGICAEVFGYRAAFLVSSGLMVAATFLVIFATKESTEEEHARDENKSDSPKPAGAALSWAIMPILLMLLVASMARRFDLSFLPLLVQDIHGSLKGAAGWTGSLKAVSCVAGLLAGWMIGPLSCGVVAKFYGLRAIYLLGMVLFAILIAVTVAVASRRPRNHTGQGNSSPSFPAT